MAQVKALAESAIDAFVLGEEAGGDDDREGRRILLAILDENHRARPRS